MKTAKLDLARDSVWQRIFLQSKANGAFYRGEQLPSARWQWPKNTYLQQRLRAAGVSGNSQERQWKQRPA